MILLFKGLEAAVMNTKNVIWKCINNESKIKIEHYKKVPRVFFFCVTELKSYELWVINMERRVSHRFHFEAKILNLNLKAVLIIPGNMNKPLFILFCLFLKLLFKRKKINLFIYF